MIFECFKFIFFKTSTRQKDQNFDEYEEYSSTVYLQNRVMKNINAIEMNDFTENFIIKTELENIYTLPVFTFKRDFCDLFRCFYQKCLYGSLTTIPRSLYYTPPELIIKITFKTINIAFMTTHDDKNEDYNRRLK